MSVGEVGKWGTSEGVHHLPFHSDSLPSPPLNWLGPHRRGVWTKGGAWGRQVLEEAPGVGGSLEQKGGAGRVVETGATPSPETDGETERHRDGKEIERGGGAARAGQAPRGGRRGPADRLACSPL